MIVQHCWAWSCRGHAFPAGALVATCLKTFNINLGVTIGSGDKQTTIDVQGLPGELFRQNRILG